MARSRVILPKQLAADPRRMARAIANGLNAQALAVKVDFEVTTATWSDKPSFTVEVTSPYERVVSTGDEVYTMLNDGTDPHEIRPKNGKFLRFRGPFQAKTVPNQISSGPGSKGTNITFSRGVRHPGTKPRRWDTAIAKKQRRLFGKVMQRAIDSEVS